MHTSNSRLHVYNSILSKYDFIDKYVNLTTTKNLHLTKVKCAVYGIIKTNLNSIFFNEFLSYKKSYFKPLSKIKKSKQNYFKTTFNIKYLFFCLEFLLNTTFLFSEIIFEKDKSNSSIYTIKFPVMLSFNSLFTSVHFPENLNFQSFKITLLLSTCMNSTFLRSYLFLPV